MNQSVVSAIPTKLGDLFDFKNGRSFKKSEWSTDGKPIIRIQNLNDPEASFNYFNGTFADDILISSGDLLFSWSGTVGSSFGPHIWTRNDGVLNQHIFKVLKKKEIDTKYAFYALRQITQDIEQQVSGSVGLVHITKRRLNEFEIPVPPPPEQRRIVAVLDEAFEGIAAAKANAEKNLENAREVFESKLNQVFCKKRKGLKEKTLAELCIKQRVITYGVIKLGEPIADGVPCLRTSNVKPLRIDLTGMKRIDHALSEKYSRTILEGGEVLVNVRGTLGGVAEVKAEMAGWNVSREVAVVPIDKAMIQPSYAALWIAAKNQQDWLSDVKKGAAYTGINIEDLRRLPVLFPDKKEQLKLVELLETCKSFCSDLERNFQENLIALDELKKSLLHQAFNGDL